MEEEKHLDDNTNIYIIKISHEGGKIEICILLIIIVYSII